MGIHIKKTGEIFLAGFVFLWHRLFARCLFYNHNLLYGKENSSQTAPQAMRATLNTLMHT